MKIYIDKYEGNGKFKEKSIDINKVATEIGLLLVLERALSNPVHANSVSQGLQPIIDILKDLAEPVSYGFMIKGFLKIMSGEETEGYKTIKHAIAGFIGIQWIPMIFRLIKSIKFLGGRIMGFIRSGIEWTGEKIGEGIIYSLKWIGKKIGNVALSGESIFVIAAIIGVYLSMAGNKKLGTKISSISMLTYLIVKVVMG